MRDKIFGISEGLSPTDTTTLHEAREAGSSVHISWFAFILIVIIACAGLAVATKVIKKGDKAGGADGAKK
jgi:hypothetical protein